MSFQVRKHGEPPVDFFVAVHTRCRYAGGVSLPLDLLPLVLDLLGKPSQTTKRRVCARVWQDSGYSTDNGVRTAMVVGVLHISDVGSLELRRYSITSR